MLSLAASLGGRMSVHFPLSRYLSVFQYMLIVVKFSVFLFLNGDGLLLFSMQNFVAYHIANAFLFTISWIEFVVL